MKVWQDLDQDGEVDEGELRTLEAEGITEIGLVYDDGSDYAERDDDVAVGGVVLHGAASYVRDGVVVAGGVGDVTLAWDTLGWRRVAA